MKSSTDVLTALCAELDDALKCNKVNKDYDRRQYINFLVSQLPEYADLLPQIYDDNPGKVDNIFTTLRELFGNSQPIENAEKKFLALLAFEKHSKDLRQKEKKDAEKKRRDDLDRLNKLRWWFYDGYTVPVYDESKGNFELAKTILIEKYGQDLVDEKEILRTKREKIRQSLRSHFLLMEYILCELYAIQSPGELTHLNDISANVKQEMEKKVEEAMQNTEKAEKAEAKISPEDERTILKLFSLLPNESWKRKCGRDMMKLVEYYTTTNVEYILKLKTIIRCYSGEEISVF